VNALYGIFFLSGISGLVYQVVWVRWFGRLFGNSVHSASLVVAVFMLGLGVGSYLAGRWIDGRDRRGDGYPVRIYAYAELGIAALAALIALLLPALEPLAAHISHYTRGADGWYELSATSYAARYLVAVVLLTPVTTLMGATLTLLIRHLLSTDLSLAGWRVGALYGFNTAGAALGAFLSDFALVPLLGLFATQMLAVVVNLLAAAAALAWIRRAPAGRPAPETPPRTAPEAPRLVWGTALAISLSGAAAMSVEILWFRYLSMALGSHRAVFSLLMSVMLCGMWLGALAGGWCHRRFGRPALLYAITQTGFLLVVVATFAFISPDLYAEAPTRAAGAAHILWTNVRPIVLLVAAPALLLGFAYPTANAHVQRAQAHVGRRAGLLYLANTIGAVVGATATGFLLIPTLGMQRTLWVIAAATAASVLALWPTITHPGRGRVLGGCVAALAAALLFWARLPEHHLLQPAVPPGETLVTLREGINEVVAITTTGPGDFRLNTNGDRMSTTDVFAQRYMRAFSHLPLLQLEDPTDVLVICFGVGSTAHAASLHPTVERLDVVDLSRDVLEHAAFFEGSNRGVLRDPRVRVHVNDGRQHLWMRPESSYDLVTLEPPPLADAGVAALYSEEFYRLVFSRLKARGFVSQWLPAFQMPEDVVRSMVRAFIDVFPDSVILSGYLKDLILLGRRDAPITLDIEGLRLAIEANPRVADDLRAVHLGTLTEIAGTFVGSADTMRAATAKAAPLVDDLPSMEYVTQTTDVCATNQLPRDLVDVRQIGAWCPDCGTVPLLDRYLAVLSALYASPGFQRQGCFSTQSAGVRLPVRANDEVFQKTSYLRAVFTSPR